MTSQALISIIMPAHNAGAFIAEALDSIQQQTYPNWELLLLDDASTDNTAEVIKPYLSDNRIRYHKLERIGHPAGVRNLGLRVAIGDYIAFLDSDDAFLPNALEVMLTALEEHPEWHTVRGFQQWMDKNSDPIGGNYTLPLADDGSYYLPEEYHITYEKLVLSKNMVSVLPALMMRRDAFESVGFLNESLKAIEDYEYYLRLYLYDFKGFGVIPAYIYRYRVYSESLTQDKNRFLHNIESGLQVMDWLFEQPELPVFCQALKGQAYGRRYQIFARYQLNLGNHELAQELVSQAWKNKNVSRSFFYRNLFPLYLRTLLPNELNHSLVRMRWILKNPQQAFGATRT